MEEIKEYDTASIILNPLFDTYKGETKLITIPKGGYCSGDARNKIEFLRHHAITRNSKVQENLVVYTDVERGGKKMYLKGLLPRLKKKFYEDNIYMKPERETGWTWKEKKKGGCSSKELGITVHRHIQHMIECKREDKCTCGVQRITKTHVGRKWRPVRPHRFAKEILSILEDHELTPLCCEFMIVSPTAQFFTKIDLLCERKKKVKKIVATGNIETTEPTVSRQQRQRDNGYIETTELVNVSIKTGGAYGKASKLDHMMHPLQHVLRTPKNKNQLQLIAECMAVEREYGVKIDSAYILYLNVGSKQDKGEPLEPLQPWVCDKNLQAQFWSKLCK